MILKSKETSTHSWLKRKHIWRLSKSLIDALPKILRADPIAKKVTQRLATKESNLDLNIDLRDWMQMSSSTKDPYYTYPRLRSFGCKSGRNTMMTPLLVTWLPRKRRIHSATNTCCPTCTSRWTHTVLSA